MLKNCTTAKNKVGRLIYLFAPTVIFAVIIIIISLKNESVWMDEALSMATARQSLEGLFKFCLNDAHPPLFFLILKVSLFFFGNTVFVAKMTVLLPSVLTLIAIAYFLNRNVDMKASIFCQLCCISLYQFVLYSYEMRGYSWALFFVSMTCISAWYYLFKNSMNFFWSVCLCLFSLAAAFTHYYAGAEAALILAVVLFMAIKQKRLSRHLLILFFICFIVYSIWIAALLIQIRAKPELLTSDRGFAEWTIIDSVRILTYTFSIGSSLTVFSKLYNALFVICLVAACWFFWIKNNRSDLNIFFSGILIFILLSTLGVLVSTFYIPVFHPRYLFPLTGIIMVSFAICYSVVCKKSIACFMSVMILLLSISNLTYCFKKELIEGREYNKYISFAKSNIKETDILVFPDSWLHLMHVNAYLFPNHTFISQDWENGPFSNEILWEMYGIEQINVSNFNAQHSVSEGVTFWFFILNYNESSEQRNRIQNLTYCGSFGWGMNVLRNLPLQDGYMFDVYKTDSVDTAVSELKCLTAITN
jgi:hypothetical protein